MQFFQFFDFQRRRLFQLRFFIDELVAQQIYLLDGSLFLLHLGNPGFECLLAFFYVQSDIHLPLLDAFFTCFFVD